MPLMIALEFGNALRSTTSSLRYQHVRSARQDIESARPGEALKSISFSITRGNSLRHAAARAREIPDERSGTLQEEWSASTCDANQLISVFDMLRIKQGFTLRASECRGGRGGNGIIWVVPADAPQLPPDNGTRIHGSLSNPRKPPGAVPLMQAIEGDGSPWSFLSASILRREAAEFGALWHGWDWTPQTILSKPSRQVDGSDVLDDEEELNGDAPTGDWTGPGPAPTTWEPTYDERRSTRRIVLPIRNPVGGEEICKATDSCRADSYDCTTKTSVLCTAPGGFLY